jgi:phosphate acetyltransferase
MNLTYFLDHIGDGDLIITPGDRGDVILASLATTLSETMPNIVGLLLTGGLFPEDPILRLIQGLKKYSPIRGPNWHWRCSATVSKSISVHIMRSWAGLMR